LRKARNWLVFALVVLIWSSNWSVMKTALNIVDPLNVVFQRFFISTLALTPTLIMLRSDIPRDSETIIKLFLLGIINTFGVISTHVGLVFEKSGVGAVLTYTQPLFVFCLAVPFLKEELKLRRVAGIALGFTGVTILYLRKGFTLKNVSTPSLLLLVGAFIWAVSIVFYKKSLNHVNPIITNLFQQSTGATLVLVLNLSVGDILFPTDSRYLLLMLYMSLGSSTIAMTMWVHLLREEEATVISTSSFIIPAVALLLGSLILKESLEPISTLGITLTLIGVFLVNKT